MQIIENQLTRNHLRVLVLMVSAHSLSMDIIMDIEMIETEREMCGSEQVYLQIRRTWET